MPDPGLVPPQLARSGDPFAALKAETGRDRNIAVAQTVRRLVLPDGVDCHRVMVGVD